MSSAHWYISIVYVSFVGLATLLTLLRRRPVPESAASVRRKYPLYILINLIFLGATWLPQEWHVLTAILALIGGLVSCEITRALGAHERISRIISIMTATLVASADWLSPENFTKLEEIAFFAAVVVISLTVSREQIGRHLLCLMAALIYLPICLAAYLRVWHTDSAGLAAAFLYIVVAANDAFAMIVGQLLGRHPLAPRISPAKTMEGALGGIIIASLLAATMSQALGWFWPFGAVLGVAISAAGVVGDLIESSWKRALGLKDLSTLLGAQGGVFDRFDALIFAAPIFCWLLSA